MGRRHDDGASLSAVRVSKSLASWRSCSWLYGAGEFLQVQDYANVLRWTDEIARRPAAQRGRMVNRTWGQPSSQLHERHDASDFETRTADKLAPSAP